MITSNVNARGLRLPSVTFAYDACHLEGHLVEGAQQTKRNEERTVNPGFPRVRSLFEGRVGSGRVGAGSG